MRFSEKLKDSYALLSSGKQKIAKYVMENMQIAAYCSASKMAETCQVSNAQVVKFLKSLGFTSYKEMQQEIQKELQSRSLMSTQLKDWMSTEKAGKPWMRFMNNEIANIKKTLQDVDYCVLYAVAENILSARRLAFVGARGVAGCNVVPQVFLSEIRPDVISITQGINNSADVLKWWGKGDLVIGASVGSLGRGFTPQTLEKAKDNGCTTVWFTDEETFFRTPSMGFDYVVTHHTNNGIISFTSLLSLYNLLVYLAMSKADENVIEQIEYTEKLLGYNLPQSGQS